MIFAFNCDLSSLPLFKDKDTGIIMSLGTILQSQSKETASSLTAVNMKQKAQKAHIYHFIVPKSLSKAMGNMTIPKWFSPLLAAVEECLFISV